MWQDKAVQTSAKRLQDHNASIAEKTDMYSLDLYEYTKGGIVARSSAVSIGLNLESQGRPSWLRGRKPNVHCSSGGLMRRWKKFISISCLVRLLRYILAGPQEKMRVEFRRHDHLQ